MLPWHMQPPNVRKVSVRVITAPLARALEPEATRALGADLYAPEGAAVASTPCAAHLTTGALHVDPLARAPRTFRAASRLTLMYLPEHAT